MNKRLAKLLRRLPGRLVSMVMGLPVLVYVLYVRHILRKPVWYTDRNKIIMEFLPTENLYHYFRNRLVLDDPGSAALLQRIVKPGMVVFDIGAHAGAFALLAAQCLKGRGAVHAFEPTSSTYERLLRNIAQNGAVGHVIIPNRLAVSSVDGSVTLNTFPAHLSAWNTMGKPEMEYEGGVKIRPSSSEQVTSVMVDSYCREHGVEKIDLLKIDVEGFEDEVIGGSADMIRRHAVGSVLFEISLAPLESTGKTPQSVLRTFADRGFRLYLIAEDGSTQEISDISRFDVPYFANYYGVYTRA